MAGRSGMAGRVGGRRRWAVGASGLGSLAALIWLALKSPAGRGGRALDGLDPAELATLEQAAWEAYYYRQWPRLFRLLLVISRRQFNLSWAQTLYSAYLATRAQVVFARRGAADGAAERLMRRYYALVRGPSGGQYRPEHAAAAELNWWVVHRNRHQYADYSELERAMTKLYAALYQLPPAAVSTAARHRVAAVAVSDRWLDAKMPAGSPLLMQVRDELLEGYIALKAAIGEGAGTRRQ